MYPSTFNGIDFVKIDIPNNNNFDKNVYKFSKKAYKVGVVSYFYRISKYQITNKIFNIFLSKNNLPIIQMSDNLPVVNISFLDACKFCNWLTSGCINTGTYKIQDNKAKLVSRNGYYLPNEHEWHKAAFYNPVKEEYFLYATSSNTPPKICHGSLLEKNTANFMHYKRTEDALLKKGFDKTGDAKIMPVGVLINSFSPFGTYDQNGNVWEMIDTDDTFVKSIKGGSAFSSVYSLKSTFTSVCNINTRSSEIGFRICRGF